MLRAGPAYTCALGEDGTLWCWGDNADGQLGDGTTIARSTPTRVPITAITDVATGGQHVCVLAAGHVYCWGNNRYAQLGDATMTAHSTPQIASAVTLAASQITAGARHTCVLDTFGTVSCWGDASAGATGEYADFTPTVFPHSVVGLGSVTVVRAGEQHNFALRADGTVMGWGGGSLGDGAGATYAAHPTPVAVAGLANATTVDAGGDSSCSIDAAGVLQCWGTSSFGWGHFDRATRVAP
jgi:alpha-tubulin suppressor-like RCC1 family protein